MRAGRSGRDRHVGEPETEAGEADARAGAEHDGMKAVKQSFLFFKHLARHTIS